MLPPPQTPPHEARSGRFGGGWGRPANKAHQRGPALPGLTETPKDRSKTPGLGREIVPRRPTWAEDGPRGRQ
eukprot:3846010-Pyramimonas_sp.AAC.1